MSTTFGFSLGWLIFITVILFALFYAKVFQTAEKSSIKESFDTTIIPDDKGIQEGQKRFNDFMNLVNVSNPQLPFSQTTETDVNQALSTPTFEVTRDAKNAIGLPGVYVSKGVSEPYKIPSGQSDTLQTAQSVCEKVVQPDCSAFGDPNFAKQCGISFDKNGMDSRGQPHIGGLYISETDRTNQLQQAHRDGVTIDRIQFTPSLGKAKKGLFAIDASSCQLISGQQTCSSSMQLGPNCGQCYTDGSFYTIDPKTPRIAPSLIYQTNASTMSITWGSASTPKQYTITPDSPTTIDIVGTEGDIFLITLTGDPANIYFCGYLTAPTARGAFTIDLLSLVDVDTVTNYKPRLGGSQDINGIRCMIMRPGLGNGQMILRGHIPFSFLSPYETDARLCDNGPFLTTQSSADFLDTNPCFRSNPGNYSLECLQQMFLSMGGTTQGKGYPKDTPTSHALLFDSSGKSRSLQDISNFLYDINIRASTGKDTTGNSLSLNDWNQATLFVTGTTKKTACGDSNKDTGPLSKDCLQYLYTNGGYGNTDGATYTLGLDYTSLDANGNRVYCRPEGRLSPTKADGLARAQKVGGMQAVKQLYNTAHTIANDNTRSNSDRKDAILDCYGDSLLQ